MHLNFNFIYYKVTAVALVVCLLLPKEKRQSASKVKKAPVTQDDLIKAKDTKA